MISIQENIPLAPFTTFKIGGLARFFVAVSSEETLKEALREAKERKLPVFVLGGGSNILFSDRGFDGLVIKIENKEIAHQGTVVIAGAGVSLMEVVTFSAEHGLAGIERLAGVPGSLGGAVRGNAGAFGTEMKDVVTEVIAVHRETLEVKTYSRQDCAFGYRESLFKKYPELLVFSAQLSLSQGDSATLLAVMKETVAAREAKHSQSALCAGSFFINPTVTDENLRSEFESDTGMAPRGSVLPAGWLIDYVGLRGKKIGGAMVSEQHPNYILNTGNATAEDILILTSLIKQRVRTQLNVQLKEEVQMVGF